MDIKVTSKTSFSAISLAAMRNYLKFEEDNTSEDLLIDQLLNAAVEKVEDYCNIALRDVTYTVVFDEFDIDEGSVMLPIAPFKSVTSVSILDKYGNETADTNYTQSGNNIIEIYSPIWADGYRIKVVYVAGYASDVIPQIALTAIQKIVSDWYENRGDHVISGEVRRMLNQISYSSWI